GVSLQGRLRRRRSDFSPPVISRIPSFSPPFKLTIRFLFSDLKPHLVELRRGSVTAGVVGDHIFSDCKSSIF
ncbi:hypothetical protein HID58_061686, partial [Brassica napus]